MEPQINKVQSVIEPLKKVTPVSKYLAMALFVLLPFLGGWVGYTLAPEKVVEVERIVHQEVDAKSATTDDPMKTAFSNPEWETLDLDLEANDFSFQYPQSWALADGGEETIAYVGDVHPVYFTKGKEYEMNNFIVHYGVGGCVGEEIQLDSSLIVSEVNGNDSLWQPSVLGECREIRFENGITISMSAHEQEQKEIVEKILSTFRFTK